MAEDLKRIDTPAEAQEFFNDLFAKVEQGEKKRNFKVRYRESLGVFILAVWGDEEYSIHFKVDHEVLAVIFRNIKDAMKLNTHSYVNWCRRTFEGLIFNEEFYNQFMKKDIGELRKSKRVTAYLEFSQFVLKEMRKFSDDR